MKPIKVLIVATSHEHLGDTNRKTGLWLEELAIPYYIFKDAGVLITLCSPKGGEVPLDPKSESIIVSNSTTKKFQKDPETISLLAHAALLSAQKAEDFDLVFLAGGHGSMWDFPDNEALRHLLEDFNRQHKLIGAVCHGVVALLDLKDNLGEPLLKGRKVTAFSDSEEKIWGLTDIIPFSLESRLISTGASFSKGPEFLGHVVTDDNIITGQNPSSSRDLARKLLTGFKELPKKAEAAMY